MRSPSIKRLATKVPEIISMNYCKPDQTRIKRSTVSAHLFRGPTYYIIITIIIIIITIIIIIIIIIIINFFYEYSRLPVTWTLYNSSLPLTRSNFHSPSDHFLYNFTLDNWNSRWFDLFFYFPWRFELSRVDCIILLI